MNIHFFVFITYKFLRLVKMLKVEQYFNDVHIRFVDVDISPFSYIDPTVFSTRQLTLVLTFARDLFGKDTNVFFRSFVV